LEIQDLAGFFFPPRRFAAPFSIRNSLPHFGHSRPVIPAIQNQWFTRDGLILHGHKKGTK